MPSRQPSPILEQFISFCSAYSLPEPWANCLSQPWPSALRRCQSTCSESLERNSASRPWSTLVWQCRWRMA